MSTQQPRNAKDEPKNPPQAQPLHNEERGRVAQEHVRQTGNQGEVPASGVTGDGTPSEDQRRRG